MVHFSLGEGVTELCMAGATDETAFVWTLLYVDGSWKRPSRLSGLLTTIDLYIMLLCPHALAALMATSSLSILLIVTGCHSSHQVRPPSTPEIDTPVSTRRRTGIIGVQAWGLAGCSPLEFESGIAFFRKSPNFSGSSQQQKWKKWIFVVLIKRQKMEFVLSNEMKDPKSIFY